MTRFEEEYKGLRGEFWAKHAKEEVAKMQKRVDNDELRTNTMGGAFWNINGNYLSADIAEILSYTDFPFSLVETARARKAQVAMQLEAYAKNQKAPSEEEKAEMRAAFGAGTTVVNVITGERVRV